MEQIVMSPNDAVPAEVRIKNAMMSREQRNAHLFAMVRSTVKDGGNKARIDEWLIELERDANNTYPGWGDRLRGFIRGLWAAGLVDLAGIDQIENELLRR